MTMTPIVKNILENNFAPRIARVLEIQKRYDDLVERGIIQEEPPKTFGNAALIVPNDLKNKHIDYTLSEKAPF